MTDKPRVGQGEVEIALLDAAGNPEKLVLRPSYGAARTISAQAGGLLGAMERVARGDVDAAVQVVQLGLGYHGNARPPADLAERIWSTGFSDDSGGVLERCILFLRVLMSGGKMPAEQKAAEDGGPNAQTPS